MVALPSTAMNPFSSALNHPVSPLETYQESAKKPMLSQGLTMALLELRAAEQSLLLAHQHSSTMIQNPEPSPWLVNNFLMSYSPGDTMATPTQQCVAPPVGSHRLNQQQKSLLLQQAHHLEQYVTRVTQATPSTTSSTPTLDDGATEKSSSSTPRTRRVASEDGLKDIDILCGRGGKSNHHIGNKRFRKLVSDMKARYKNIDTKMAKTELSRAIVEHVYRQGGRFVRFDKESLTYVSMSLDDARKKTSQALRESKDVKWII
eukprot:Nitzschia sp. Nitz4//scaffold103_size77763//5764//6546//NITZ4_005436-RA/size77763-processed-gene-0.18-mRNA-1//-1//CDS//3329532301//3289//frame0